VVVGIATDQSVPRVVLSTFPATAAERDRLALEPYHVAFEMMRGPYGEAHLTMSAKKPEL
jgi:hypothetical protein